MTQSKSRELFEELRTIFMGRSLFLDTILPPILFLLVNALAGFQAAMWSALALAVVIGALRIVRRQPLAYALGGIASVVLAIAVVRLLGRSEGFFLPGLVSGSVTLLLTVLSLVFHRPLVAWTSFIARRWPLDWYWHPQVRPAYSETTLAWAVLFAIRLLLQYSVYRSEDLSLLALTNLVTGWPFTLILLVLTYLYGTWRLGQLRGPSVEEYKNNTPPPWQGQRRGF